MQLANMKVAILVTNGFEQSEMLEPKKALEAVGAIVVIVSPEEEKIKSWVKGNWGEEFCVNINLDNVNPEEYHGLVLPGGVINSDKLRMNEKAIRFVKHFIKTQKPIAAICHAPWILIEAQGIKDHTLTSWPSLKTDLTNAGARWVDQEVVRDNKLITSRKPDDLPAFNRGH